MLFISFGSQFVVDSVSAFDVVAAAAAVAVAAIAVSLVVFAFACESNFCESVKK